MTMNVKMPKSLQDCTKIAKLKRSLGVAHSVMDNLIQLVEYVNHAYLVQKTSIECFQVLSGTFMQILPYRIFLMIPIHGDLSSEISLLKLAAATH